MASMKIEGLVKFSKQIDQLANSGQRLCKYALFDGAKVVADGIKSNIQNLSVVTNQYVNETSVTQDNPPSIHKLSGLSSQLKSELQDALGIAQMRDSGGEVSTIIGFNGYSAITTEKYGSGLPLQMIARSVESGSAYRESQPFVRPAVNRTKEQAKAAMDAAAKKYIDGFGF